MDTETLHVRTGGDEVVLDLTRECAAFVRGKGDGLDMPNLGLLASPLTVQLKRAGGSVCWGATYSFPPALKNTAAMFKDKAD